MSATCKVDSCNGRVIARELCRMHYGRWWRHGDINVARKPRPTHPTIAFCDSALSSSVQDCINWPFGLDGVGYGRLYINGRRVSAHRYVCETAHGQAPPEKSQVAHSCGNRRCVNPAHLRWASQSENEADKIAHGRSARGSANGCAKLTAQDVAEIRSSKMSGAALARKFNVRDGQISRIRKGQRWAHLS